MKKNTFFKRSLFGGFKREDVINYIDKKSANEALTSETDKYRSDNASLSISLGESTLSLNKVKAELSDSKSEYERLREENSLLKAENEKYQSKIERACEIESHVGGMIADAKIYKEKLIADAKNEISTISASYCSAAKEITDKIDSFTDELNDLSAGVSASLSSIMDSLIKMSNEIERSKNSFTDTESNKSNLSSGVCGYSLDDTGTDAQHPQPVLGSESLQNTDAPSFPAVDNSHSGIFGDFSSAFNDLLGCSGSIIN